MKIKRLQNHNNSPHKQGGFNILESMAALALLSLFTINFFHYKVINNQKKDAKVLANQTSNYAVTFARYMNSNQESLISKAANSPVVLSPGSISANWPEDLDKQNLFHQTPCLVVVTNHTTKHLEAKMYYVGGNTDTSPRNLQIVRDGSIFLGSKGGILINGEIAGNSGWNIKHNSPFLSSASLCGGIPSNNSLAVDLDLFMDWNQGLQPINSLLRGLDKTPGIQSLPGHLRNSNTSKSNLYFNQNHGIILDNTQDKIAKLSVLYNGQGTEAATIGTGTTITTIRGDTLKPNLQLQAGQCCTAQELGKLVLDLGLNNSDNTYLAKSTLVCTQNDMLCGSGKYCYLPSITNNIIFQNTTQGIQDANGNFYCPPEVPFAKAYSLSIPSGQAYVFMSNRSSTVPDYINVIYENTNGSNSNWTPWNYFGDGEYFMTDFNNARDRAGLLKVDLATIKGSAVGTTTTPPGSAIPITGTIGQYSVVRGFSVQTATANCNNICAAISNIAGFTWEKLGTRRALRNAKPDFSILNQNLGCGCERTDFTGANQDNYAGVAAVIGDFTAKITSVTCTNTATYTSAS